MARVWIGDTENLKTGDTITDWSPNDRGGITLEVERLDEDTIRVVLNEVLDRINGPRGNIETWRHAIEGVAKDHGVDL